MKKIITNSQSGNALFLILIAVVLFAALSYAVSQSGVTGGHNTGRENAKLVASEINNYIVSLKTSITRLSLRNCSQEALSFERPPFDGSDTDYVNPNSPANFTCHIFHPDGGAVNYINANDKWLDMGFASNFEYGDLAFMVSKIRFSSRLNIGTSASDLIVLVPYVSKGVCEDINEKNLGNKTIGVETNIVGTKFTGSYVVPGDIDNPFSPSFNFLPDTYCIQSNDPYPADSYAIYSILLAR